MKAKELDAETSTTPRLLLGDEESELQASRQPVHSICLFRWSVAKSKPDRSSDCYRASVSMAPAKTQLTHRQRERTGNDRRGGEDVVKTSPASDSQHLLCHPRERQAANLLDGHGSGRLHCATAPARVRVPDVLLGLSFADLRLDGAPVAASGCALSRRLPGAPQPGVSPAFVRSKTGVPMQAVTEQGS